MKEPKPILEEWEKLILEKLREKEQEKEVITKNEGRGSIPLVEIL